MRWRFGAWAISLAAVVTCACSDRRTDQKTSAEPAKPAKSSEPQAQSWFFAGNAEVIPGTAIALVPIQSSTESHGWRADLESSSSGGGDSSPDTWNLAFADLSTGETRLLWDRQALILNFEVVTRDGASESPVGVGVLMDVVEKDTDGDNALTAEDGSRAYLADVAGKSLAALTPDGTQLVNWEYDQGAKAAILRVRLDSDHDRVFSDDDETVLMRYAFGSAGEAQPLLDQGLVDRARAIATPRKDK